MTPEQITSLGEAAAKAALRAIQKADRIGVDQNRGQFVQMVAMALEAIPEGIRGEAAVSFLAHEAKAPYGGQRASVGRK